MIMQPERTHATHTIESICESVITCNQQKHHESFAIHNDQLLPWPDKPFEQLSIQDFTAFFDTPPEIFIYGSGTSLKLLPNNIINEFYKHNIGVECMTTRNAAKTFNLLLCDLRSVSVILVI